MHFLVSSVSHFCLVLMCLYVLCHKMRKNNDEGISVPILERRWIGLLIGLHFFSLGVIKSQFMSAHQQVSISSRSCVFLISTMSDTWSNDDQEICIQHDQTTKNVFLRRRETYWAPLREKLLFYRFLSIFWVVLLLE